MKAQDNIPSTTRKGVQLEHKPGCKCAFPAIHGTSYSSITMSCVVRGPTRMPDDDPRVLTDSTAAMEQLRRAADTWHTTLMYEKQDQGRVRQFVRLAASLGVSVPVLADELELEESTILLWLSPPGTD
jgi:hypothetical protein